MNRLKSELKRRITEEAMPSYIYTYPTKRAYKPFTDWKKACASWQEVRGPLALYIHIPFCEMKCAFCDLFTVTSQPQDVFERYVMALLQEIALVTPYLRLNEIIIHSIYFGGGTPSLLSFDQLTRLLTRLRETFVIASTAEISIEGAPNSFTEEKFAFLQSLGFTRVSIGIQSFSGAELRAMNRLYEPSIGSEIAKRAVASGIKNVNLDLIYGIPGQELEQWKKNLITALEIGPSTITTYPLAVREQTAYGLRIARGQTLEPPQASLRYRWYDYNLELFAQYGYTQHTFVTYAKQGGGCQHEANEFVGMPTLAFGAGARKYAPNLHYVDEEYASRQSPKVTMLEYMQAIERGELLVRSAVRLDPNEQKIRYLILGLLSTGVRPDAQFSELFVALEEEGYLEQHVQKLVLSAKGKRFSSHIGHFVEWYCTKWYEQEPFGAFWERGYRDLEVSCMGGPSFEVAEVMRVLPEGAKVLDLGCGEGRNALYLAQQGCCVTAVDRSEAGINKLQILAARQGVALNALVADIRDFPFTEEYDLVMAHGVLYYLERCDWQRLLKQVKKQTKEGGFNIFTIFVYNDKYPCVQEIQAAKYKASFAPNELREFYSDWHELRSDQYVKWDAHPGIALHYHPIEKLVVQKELKTLARGSIDPGCDMKEEDFDALEMGLSESALLQRVGPPNAVDSMAQLQLYYYGRYVIYLAKGQVAGRALYSSKPVKLMRETRLIMGCPGSGKTTLARKFKEEGYFVIALGQRLRDHVQEGSATGLAIKDYVERGLLLPDGLACALFSSELQLALKTNQPICIEGFPSSMPQYEYFLQIVKQHRLKVLVTHLECADEVALQRIVKRKTHPRRPDDSLETAKRRLQTFKEVTLPIYQHLIENAHSGRLIVQPQGAEAPIMGIFN